MPKNARSVASPGQFQDLSNVLGKGDQKNIRADMNLVNAPDVAAFAAAGPW